MPTLNGAADLPSLWLGDWPWISRNFQTYDPSGGPFAAGFDSAGTLAPATPLATLPAATVSGAADRTFAQDWYNRIHIDLRAINVGNLVTPQTATVTFWNAWFAAVTMNNVAFTNGEGITVTPPAPVTVPPLRETSFVVKVGTEGPSKIDAAVAWQFSTNEAPGITITGSRIVAWTYAPDWAGGILERLEWRTDILRAYRGEEQRRALRIGPRQTLEFSLAPTGADRRNLESLLWGWGARVVALPVWMDAQELAAPLAAGAMSVPLSPTARQFEPGGLLMLLRAQTRAFEVAEVASLSVGAIALSRPTQQAWSAGTRVYPARRARLLDEARAQRWTGDAASLRLRFEMQDPAAWEASALPVYRGAPVLEELQDWTREPEGSLERNLFVFDPGTGLVSAEDIGGIPFPAQRMRYLLTGRAALDAWRKRLFALRGKQGAFWVPTFCDDLELAASTAPNGAQIDVGWLGFTQLTNPPPVQRRDIRVRLRSGAILYRRILSAVELSGTVERLSLDSALSASAINPGDVAQISFMHLSRADSDTAELAWWDGETAETALSVRAFRTDA